MWIHQTGFSMLDEAGLSREEILDNYHILRSLIFTRPPLRCSAQYHTKVNRSEMQLSMAFWVALWKKRDIYILCSRIFVDRGKSHQIVSQDGKDLRRVPSVQLCCLLQYLSLLLVQLFIFFVVCLVVSLLAGWLLYNWSVVCILVGLWGYDCNACRFDCT